MVGSITGLDTHRSESLKSIPANFRAFAETLLAFEKESRLRHIPSDRDNIGGYDLSANDYMGLGKMVMADKFLANHPKPFFSSSASRLLSAHQDSYAKLENLLSSLYSKDVLMFNSGYHANVGVIQSLAIEGTIFLCDKLIHASMIDGLKLGDAEYRRWKHNDIESLRKVLVKHKHATRIVVMVESIYSMDGDIAPLREIVSLKKNYPNIILYVDEAHAFGVRGDKGLGVCEELNILEDVDIIIGTLGKACASAGAFVATTPLLKEYFLNTCRSFIFSTALPPVIADWTFQMIIKLMDMKGAREHLKKISDQFRVGLEKISGLKTDSASQIIPLVIGDARRTVELAERLSTAGITALPIRRPTVAEGEERIRFSLSADLREGDIDLILKKLKSEYEI